MSALYARIHQPKRLDFSEDQEAAVDRIDYWRGQWPKARQVFTLSGVAGTGKTSIIAHLSRIWPNTAVVAFCGKAAHVLRSKGVEATTIHSLIYVPYEGYEGKVRYKKRRALEGIETIIADEGSMIDDFTWNDLRSFEIPILVVGDHGQLEPIGANPGLMRHPDVRLEKIHRQHADNPIIKLAAAFREGRDGPIRETARKFWKHPTGLVTLAPKWMASKLASPDYQIICGYNKTRHAINKQIRSMLHFEGQTPVRGEKIVCKQNNKDSCLFNGQEMTVVEVGRQARKTIRLTVETDDQRHVEISCLIEQFGKNKITDHKDSNVILADFGYVRTCHESQGSQWPKVMVIEEKLGCCQLSKWQYTAVTRAEQEAIYCM